MVFFKNVSFFNLNQTSEISALSSADAFSPILEFGEKESKPITRDSHSENTKALLLAASEDMNINPYYITSLTDDNTAILKSQKHLFDLIRYYEGDRYHYYEGYTLNYKDKYGNNTSGFGELTNCVRDTESSYNYFCKKVKDSMSELKKKLDEHIAQGTYERLPNSIKEGLIDLCYNKGIDKIIENSELMEAISENNWSSVIENLVYTHSGRKDASKEDDAGLYRRSLSRAILAVRDIQGSELKESKKVIEKIYNNAKDCPNQSLTDLEKIYEAFVKGEITKAPVSYPSYKYTVKKGDTLYSIAKKTLPKGQKTGDFVKLIEKYNKNGSAIKAGDMINIPVLNKTQSSSQASEESPASNAQTENTLSENEPKAQTEEPKTEKYTFRKDKTAEFKITEKYKGKGYFAAAKDLYPDFADFSLSEFCKAIEELNSDKKFKIGETIVIPIIERVNSSQNTESEAVSSDTSQHTEENADENKTIFQRMLEDKSLERKITDMGTISGIKCITFKHKVKEGETIYSIAGKSDTKWKNVLNNNDNNTNLKIGSTIDINKVVYEVQKGDTIIGIANKLGLSADLIKDMNNIEDTNVIQAGQKLEIPAYIHKVQAGDNLYRIAKRAGVPLENILAMNGIKKTDKLPTGKQLLIPYNDIMYSVPEDKIKKEEKISASGVKYTIKTAPADDASQLKDYPLLQQITMVNGKVVATRKVFEPSRHGDLSGKTIIVNAGHGYKAGGQKDCGALGSDGVPNEWLVNYQNAIKLAEQLQKRGARVIYLQGHRNLIIDALKQKNNKADLFISIHANSASPFVKDRTMFFIRGEDNNKHTKSDILADIAEKNFDKWISENEKISKSDAYYDRDGKRDYAQKSINDSRTGILKHAKKQNPNTPAILWEVAFLSSPKGRSRFKNKKLMNEYASLMADSITEYFKTQKKN